MNAVTFLVVYAVVLSWSAPALLMSPRLRGLHPRLSVAGWLAAVATASIAWVSALAILIVSTATSLFTSTAMTFCVETLGITGALMLPPALATMLVVALLALTAGVAVETVRRVTVALVRTRRRNRDHAEEVRIIGRPTDHADVVSVTADQPVAYCVSGGGRSAIVVSTAALDLLSPGGLTAVLAHERAHIRGHHHHLIALLNALAAALPRLPLMRAAAQSVPPLLEMCADDAASRLHGRAPLIASLVALSTRQRVPEGVLAAAGTAVVERVVRLTQSGNRSRRPQEVVMSVFVLAAAAAPAAALAFCAL
ncbi:peptidase M56 [Mycolicibacterium acapulense]|nr:peptidase M56 [Mycolicibacterium acapulense]KUI13353.1 peptidase M56 [Mycolicibacterium acapulense]